MRCGKHVCFNLGDGRVYRYYINVSSRDCFNLWVLEVSLGLSGLHLVSVVAGENIERRPIVL